MPQYFTSNGLLCVSEGNPFNIEIPADAIECTNEEAVEAMKICSSLSNIENNIIVGFADYFNIIKHNRKKLFCNLLFENFWDKDVIIPID